MKRYLREGLDKNNFNKLSGNLYSTEIIQLHHSLQSNKVTAFVGSCTGGRFVIGNYS
jgi:hypothetical protein